MSFSRRKHAPADASDRDSMRPSKRLKSSGTLHLTTPQPLVTIIVGIERKSHQVHENLISRHSPFFRTAFASQFAEGVSKSMTLEDVDAGIFGHLVDWLYTQDQDEIKTCNLALLNQSKLYLLAHRFMIKALEEMLIKSILSQYRDFDVTSTESIELRKYTYSDAIEDDDSPLRSLVVLVTFQKLSKEIAENVIDSLLESLQRAFPKCLL